MIFTNCKVIKVNQGFKTSKKTNKNYLTGIVELGERLQLPCAFPIGTSEGDIISITATSYKYRINLTPTNGI